MQKQEKALTLKTLNKSNVWDVQENDIFRLWQKTENDGDAKESARHYMDIVRTAFNLEILPSDDKLIASKYEKMGYKKVAHFHRCGYKFGEWYDMVWMEKLLDVKYFKPRCSAPAGG